MTKKTMPAGARLRLIRERLRDFLEEIMDSEDPSFTSAQVDDFLIERFDAIDELFASPKPVFAGPREITAIWTVNNVQTVRPDLVEDQAWEVLERASLESDYDHGICFAMLERVAGELYPSRTNQPRTAAPPAGFLTPWTLHFDRDGTDDVAAICDANGHYIVTSRHFRLPQDGDPVPPTFAAMRLMVAAPKLLLAARTAWLRASNHEKLTLEECNQLFAAISEATEGQGLSP